MEGDCGTTVIGLLITPIVIVIFFVAWGAQEIGTVGIIASVIIGIIVFIFWLDNYKNREKETRTNQANNKNDRVVDYR